MYIKTLRTTLFIVIVAIVIGYVISPPLPIVNTKYTYRTTKHNSSTWKTVFEKQQYNKEGLNFYATYYATLIFILIVFTIFTIIKSSSIIYISNSNKNTKHAICGQRYVANHENRF